MAYNLAGIAAILGVSVFLLVIIAAWSLVWKGIALWKAARKKHLVWFIILLIVNTLGILEILYIFLLSEIKISEHSQNFRRKKKF